MRVPIRLPRFSLLDVATLGLPVWLLMFACHTAADADLWGHLRFGADLLNGSGLPLRDPYSFTSDVPWINHEWLAEGITAAAFRAAGAPGLNLLKLAVIAAIGAIVWRRARGASATVRTAILLTALTLLATYTRTQVLRPQLFSVLVFALMLDVLRRFEARSTWLLVIIPALFCAWTNLHGAWIVGFAVLGVQVAGIVLERRSIRACLDGALLLLATAAATAVNPYGFAQWAFLRDTVGLSRADIADWSPLIALPAPVIALDLLLVLLATAASLLFRRLPRARHAAVVVMLLFATIRVGRVDAFLQLAVALLLAPELVALLHRAGEALDRVERLRTASTVNFVAAAGVALAAILTAAPRLTYIVVEGPWVPDREAVRYLRTEARGTRLLTWFDWGEYAIWHLSPGGIQVSMDGRRETVYSPQVLNDHWAFYRNDPGAWEYADRIRADRVWLPRQMPVVPALREHGWNIVFESDRSIVLSRDSRRTLIAASRDSSPLIFPAE